MKASLGAESPLGKLDEASSAARQYSLQAMTSFGSFVVDKTERYHRLLH